MPQERKGPALNHWLLLLSAVLIGLLLFTGISLWKRTPLANLQEKEALIANLRIELLNSQTAEKNALIAARGEAEAAYADKARSAAAAVERDRRKYAAIPADQKTEPETQAFTEFSACWSQLQQLSNELMTLSAQNTNVKARQLSERESAAALASLETALASAGESGRPVLIAALKIQALHLPHIFSPDEKEMDRLEQRSQEQAVLARKQLAVLGAAGQAASKQFEHFMQLTKQIHTLSRQNTNIHSAELEIGKKDLVASQCTQSLASLNAAVKDQHFKATR